MQFQEKDGKAARVVAGINRNGHKYIRYFLKKFERSAILGHSGILIIESRPGEKNKTPKAPSPHVVCTRIIEIPPLRIPWHDQSGPIDPVTEAENNDTWITTATKVSSPPTQGRWDMNRTNQAGLNQGKLIVYIIHKKDKPPPNTSLDIQKQARELADIFSRISSPIPPSGEKEWNVPYLIADTTKHSLALRHQAFIQGDPIDPYHTWRKMAFQASSHLPVTDAGPPAQYGPLVTLAKDGTFPHSEIPVSLIHFLTDERFCPTKGEHSAEECAINIIALRLKAYREYVELPRLHLLTLIAKKTGSPASHLVSQTPDLDPQCTCEACKKTNPNSVQNQAMV